MTQHNRLAGEVSPYLRLHSSQSVDWHPWGADALARARAEDRPILLVIGRLACPGCELMARESFEDPATAAVMNRLFVNVLVDRDERPDLDTLYQAAQPLFTRRPGGWPLTLFLAPWDGQPFFGGTYFPREAHAGMPAFVTLLERIAAFFHDRTEEIRAQRPMLHQALERLVPPAADARAPLDASPLAAARAALARAFDSRHGGFGGAPKFPQAPSLERCLRHWYATADTEAPDLQALYVATLSLTRMAEGALRDRGDGGFFGHCVDAAWQLPHAEKSLGDQGALLALYAQAALATGEPLFADVASGVAAFLARHLRAPGGAFCAGVYATGTEPDGSGGLWRRDQRIFGAGNALAIKGLALAARALDRPDLALDAGAAVDALRRDLWREGRLLAGAGDGRTLGPACLDAHAFLADALLELLQARWRGEDLALACALVDALLARFADERGGFYFTAADHERLFHRPLAFADDSRPNGNAVAATVLARLGVLLSHVGYLDAAEATLARAAPLLSRAPDAHMSFGNALEDFLVSTRIVIVRGPAAEAARWARELQRVYAPTRMIFAIPDDAAGLPDALAARRPGPATVAYVCAGMTASPPLDTLEAVADRLKSLQALARAAP